MLNADWRTVVFAFFSFSLSRSALQVTRAELSEVHDTFGRLSQPNGMLDKNTFLRSVLDSVPRVLAEVCRGEQDLRLGRQRENKRVL